MNQALKSFFLIILIEAIYAVISYLTSNLSQHMYNRSCDNDYDFEPNYRRTA